MYIGHTLRFINWVVRSHLHPTTNHSIIVTIYTYLYMTATVGSIQNIIQSTIQNSSVRWDIVHKVFFLSVYDCKQLYVSFIHKTRLEMIHVKNEHC